MSKKLGVRVVISLALVISLAFIVLVAGSKVGAGLNVMAQTEMTGDWTASLSNTRGKASGKESDAEKNDDDGKLHLNFERRSERGGRNQMGQSYDFAELQGLSREQVLGGGPGDRVGQLGQRVRVDQAAHQQLGPLLEQAGGAAGGVDRDAAARYLGDGRVYPEVG